MEAQDKRKCSIQEQLAGLQIIERTYVVTSNNFLSISQNIKFRQAQSRYIFSFCVINSSNSFAYYEELLLAIFSTNRRTRLIYISIIVHKVNQGLREVLSTTLHSQPHLTFFICCLTYTRIYITTDFQSGRSNVPANYLMNRRTKWSSIPSGE